MIPALVRRMLSTIPVLLLVTLITFLLMHAAAGEFVPGLDLNPNLRPDDIVRIRASLGLDQPLYVQYIHWLTGLVHGDFGRSLIDGTPVIDDILQRLPNTLELTLTAILLAGLLSVPLGVLGAVRRGSLLDYCLTLLSVAGVSVPSFWMGLLLILLFSVSFHAWGLPSLPSSGATSPLGGGDGLDRIGHLIMPATTLAFAYLAIWSRFIRSSMLEALAQDYVRTARAKGMTERRVLYVHSLRNALIPFVTVIGLELPGIIGGGAIVEIVFSWPGIGRLALESALRFDYTLVLGLTTFASVLVVVGNLVADVLYSLVDPRIRV